MGEYINIATQSYVLLIRYATTPRNTWPWPMEFRGPHVSMPFFRGMYRLSTYTKPCLYLLSTPSQTLVPPLLLTTVRLRLTLMQRRNHEHLSLSSQRRRSCGSD